MTLEEVDRQLFLLLAGVDVIMSGGLDVSMACKFGNRCERDSLFQQSGQNVCRNLCGYILKPSCFSSPSSMVLTASLCSLGARWLSSR